jgi:hypothetical protein
MKTYYTVSRVTTWGPEPIETMANDGTFKNLEDNTQSARFNLNQANLLVGILNNVCKPNTYEFYYSVVEEAN